MDSMGCEVKERDEACAKIGARACGEVCMAILAHEHQILGLMKGLGDLLGNKVCVRDQGNTKYYGLL